MKKATQKNNNIDLLNELSYLVNMLTALKNNSSFAAVSKVEGLIIAKLAQVK
jgi:hypothetical protein